MSDFESLDAILDAVYDCISGPAGEEPDWERERALYVPGALLVRTSAVSPDTPRAGVMDVDGFMETSSEYLRTHAFYEREVARRTQRFGNIAHVMSTYESSANRDGSDPFARGVNSMQLFHDGERWWIVSVMWDIEREGNPIPREYLPVAGP